MSRKTQRYSKEFKAEAVRTVLENQLSISEGASRLSLPEGTLGQWVTAARKGLGTPGSARWLNWNLKFCNCVRR
ncbi:transposase family protein [Shigella sonnei 53G]|nr:transposase family protein [Shigella sonnei 53G]